MRILSENMIKSSIYFTAGIKEIIQVRRDALGSLILNIKDIEERSGCKIKVSVLL